MVGVVVSLAEARKKGMGVAIIVDKRPARVIAVTSGKGGVGKTTTTVNLGMALAKEGKRVLLLDADLGLANLNIMLGFQPRKTLRDVINSQASLDEVIVQSDSGLDVIPASSGFPDMTNLSEAERLALVNAFEGFAYRYDYMLVDTAAGIGDNVLYFNAAAEEIIVIVDSEPTTLTDAYALIKVMSKDYGIHDFQVLSNRVPKGGDGRTAYSQLAATTSKFLNVRLKYLGSIEADELVSSAIRAQKPFFAIYPSSKASLDYSKVAKKLMSDTSSRQPSGSLQFFFKALLVGDSEPVVKQK